MNQKVDYLNGFATSSKNYIEESYVSTKVCLNPLKPHEGALSFDPTDECVVFDDDFCMVMSHQTIEENIKVPFAFGYIKKKDWIQDE